MLISGIFNQDCTICISLPLDLVSTGQERGSGNSDSRTESLGVRGWEDLGRELGRSGKCQRAFHVARCAHIERKFAVSMVKTVLKFPFEHQT